MKSIHKFERFASSVILAVMTVVTFIAAVNRFTFNFSLPWSEELVRFLVMWMTMVGAAMGVGTNEHVGIDVFVTHFPKVMQFIIALIMDTIGMFFSVVFCYIGIQMVQKQYMQTSTAMGLSMGVVYACVVVGGALMFTEFAYKLYTHIKEHHAAKGGDVK